MNDLKYGYLHFDLESEDFFVSCDDGESIVLDSNDLIECFIAVYEDLEPCWHFFKVSYDMDCGYCLKPQFSIDGDKDGCRIIPNDCFLPQDVGNLRVKFISDDTFALRLSAKDFSYGKDLFIDFDNLDLE